MRSRPCAGSGAVRQCRSPSACQHEIQVRIYPQPIQPELPIWITAAGDPETFRVAGEMGANLLTHLLGHTVEALAEKIAVYRKAWRDSGHGDRTDATATSRSCSTPS